MALSIGFGNSVSLLFAIQATRLLTFASVGLSPTEHSSLSWTRFRKAGFPRYGFKAGMSDGPSCRPRVLRVVQFASALRAPRCLKRRILVLSRGARCAGAPPCKRHWPLYPRGPRSGPSYSVSVHHHLIGPIRPTRQHIAISPECGLYAMPSLCPKGLGDQRVVPGFRCLLLLCMSSSRIPGDPSTVPAQLHRRRLRPSP